MAEVTVSSSGFVADTLPTACDGHPRAPGEAIGDADNACSKLRCRHADRMAVSAPEGLSRGGLLSVARINVDTPRLGHAP